ncbi:hypothetical protein EST38_g10654 [Candolleomyces aberdarensis]|uniref:F-box domain-containing protein n=1 Tax=Candolleomyces aberdarensis TaxID=2316362 RepID=A0A4Q2D933_9AGAR|nr:hypothetical protein EST38_g10654 [Candolleomyces aberdarensis]
MPPLLPPLPISSLPPPSTPMTSAQLKSTKDLSVLKQPKVRDTASNIAARMILLITLLGVHICGAASVFGAPEILMEILSYCDFPTVMAVSRTNKHGRRVAQIVVRDRFRQVLAPFVGSAQFTSFVRMLTTTGSAVNGSIVRRLLAQQCDFMLLANSVIRYNRSANVNIITPRGQLDSCKSWFTDNEGYTIWERKTIAIPYKTVVRDLWVGEKPRCADDRNKLKVVIAHADSTIVNVILASPFTTQTNMITGAQN